MIDLNYFQSSFKKQKTRPEGKKELLTFDLFVERDRISKAVSEGETFYGSLY